jgi:lysyl-tRNA synthetase class 1
MERNALKDLLKTLANLPAGSNGSEIQTQVYEVGKRHAFEDLKAWFKCLYEILLGQTTGPRMGSFIALYGIEETKVLIEKVLVGKSLN